MFSGIIAGKAEVVSVTRREGGLELRLRVPNPEGLSLGSSLAVNGVCLTVTAIDGDTLTFDAVGATLDRTLLGDYRAGDRVNVEKSLAAGGTLDGHLVTGHVDGVGTVVARTPGEGAVYFDFRAPGELLGQIALRGSIAVDGVSLTVASVDGALFRVSVVPFTLMETTFDSYQPGHRVHLETDILAKYVDANLKHRSGETAGDGASLEKMR